jgi:hypothetical protein
LARAFQRRARLFIPAALFVIGFVAAGDLPVRALGYLVPSAMTSPLFSPMAFGAESMILISPMTMGQNAAAFNGRFASVSTGASDGDCNVSRPGGAAIQQFTTTARAPIASGRARFHRTLAATASV